MIEIVNGNDTIKIPEEMTIGIFIEYTKNKELYDSDPVKFISLYTGITEKELKSSPRKTIQLVYDYLISKLKAPKTDELVTTFIHNGIEYGLETDFGKMAWGAWVDLEVYSSENINENIHKIMSVLYRPILTRKGKKYQIEKYDSDTIEERAALFLELPITYWIQVSDFFFHIANLSIGTIKDSLEQRKKMMDLKMKGMMILPKWLQKKLLRGSILN